VHRFAYAVIAAEEITAVSNTMDFRYDDGRTFLNWPVGQNIDPAVWITLFLALVIIINMFPVKVDILILHHFRRLSLLDFSTSENLNMSLDVSRSSSSSCSS